MLICIMFYQNLTSWHKYNYSTEVKEGKTEEQNVRQCDSKEGIELLRNLEKKLLTYMKLLLLLLLLKWKSSLEAPKCSLSFKENEQVILVHRAKYVMQQGRIRKETRVSSQSVNLLTGLGFLSAGNIELH